MSVRFGTDLEAKKKVRDLVRCRTSVSGRSAAVEAGSRQG